MKSTLLLVVCLLQKQSFTHTVTEHCVWDHATDTDASTADIYIAWMSKMGCLFLHSTSSRLTSKTTGCSLQACRKSSIFRLPAGNTVEPLNSNFRVDIAMPPAALLDCHSVTCKIA